MNDIGQKQELKEVSKNIYTCYKNTPNSDKPLNKSLIIEKFS